MPVETRLSADDPVQLLPAEEPQYEGLRAAVARSGQATRAAFGALRGDWFEALGIDEQEAAGGGRQIWVPGRRSLPAGTLAAIDAAVARFLEQFAGAIRTVEHFASVLTPDAILPQHEIYTWHVGAKRAQDLLPDRVRWPMNPRFTELQRQALLRGAFERMSAEGRLRFEDRLGEIRQAMLDGFGRGENPLVVARRLSADLSGYEAGRLRTIIRTEASIASIGASQEMYRQAGVQEVEVIGDPLTDELCTVHIGMRYPVGSDELPPYHPSCMCDCLPVARNGVS